MNFRRSSKHDTRRIRVAILGCGQIADAHLSQIQRIPFAEVVGVCDVHRDLAYQAAARFGVSATFTDLDQMIEQARPDVIHITTPAQTHASLALRVLRAGCHVYVEKPFTRDMDEALQVFSAAEEHGKQVCVGHDQLFDPCWLETKRWIEQGLVGSVRHVESILGYPIEGQFGSQVSSNPRHWVRQLPGGLFQNTISHPLYRITDLIGDRPNELSARWTTRAAFSFPTELQVQLTSGERTGSLTFSTYLPPQRVTRIYGTAGTLEVDLDSQTLRLGRRTKLPGAFAKLEAPWQEFGNALWNLKHNCWRFAKADIHYFAGMKTLCEQFYRSILEGSPLPISGEEILAFTQLMDDIFQQCRENEIEPTARRAVISRPANRESAVGADRPVEVGGQ